MRAVSRLMFVALVFLLAAGPAFVGPVDLHASTTMSAPTHQAPADPTGLFKLLGFGGAIGAIRIKDTGTLAKKFVRNASAAQGDYKTGVEASGQDWATNTAASAENYAAGVQQAISDGRFAKGVSEAGSAKFVARASSLGAQRYPTGVGAAEGEWAKNTQGSLDVLKGLNLPPRRPKGDPGNQARANAVAAALRAHKLGK